MMVAVGREVAWLEQRRYGSGGGVGRRLGEGMRWYGGKGGAGGGMEETGLVLAAWQGEGLEWAEGGR